jgi:hypothetical protein
MNTDTDADPGQIVCSAPAPIPCTDMKTHVDPRLVARVSRTCPSASEGLSVYGRESSSAPHVEPGASGSGSSASSFTEGGLLVELAKSSRSATAPPPLYLLCSHLHCRLMCLLVPPQGFSVGFTNPRSTLMERYDMGFS